MRQNIYAMAITPAAYPLSGSPGSYTLVKEDLHERKGTNEG